MAIEQLELETGLNKVDYAIKLLRDYEPPEGYYLADSGGKDSCVVRDILIKSGCKFDSHYNVSPIDPPQIYQFLKEYHPDTQWDYYAKGFWNLVEKKGLPLRQRRWCCELIKESGGFGRVVITGVRSAESRRRRGYPQIRTYIKTKSKIKVMIYPILNFDDSDIWQYIRQENIPYCSLYDEGFTRLGCVLCPFSRRVELEELYFPKIVNLWKRACDRIIDARKQNGYKTATGKEIKNKFETGDELYRWWVNRG